MADLSGNQRRLNHPGQGQRGRSGTIRAVLLDMRSLGAPYTQGAALATATESIVKSPAALLWAPERKV